MASAPAPSSPSRPGRGSGRRSDAIDAALVKFRDDMRATGRMRIDGEWVEVPGMRLKPRDIAVLLDRLQGLFDRPSRLREGCEPSVRSGLLIDALDRIVGLTQGRAAPPTPALPRTRRLDD